MTYAIIDIGSNSVRLMLWAGGKTLYKKVKTTRLGEGIDGCGRLSSAAIGRTVQAVCAFAEEGRAAGAEVLAFATAAVRSAENGHVFCAQVKESCALSVDVISGEDEARLAVLGALGTEDGGIIDIGGGSTEICLERGGNEIFSRSLNVGAVRLHDSCGEDIAKLTQRIEREIAPLPNHTYGKIYAVGGTASTLASLKHGLTEYNSEVLQNTSLTLPWVKGETQRLFSLSVAERKGLKGMDSARADILPGASLLLQKIMEKMDLYEVKFSDRDNLEGYAALRGLQ